MLPVAISTRTFYRMTTWSRRMWDRDNSTENAAVTPLNRKQVAKVLNFWG
jgi:hypothetical protein